MIYIINYRVKWGRRIGWFYYLFSKRFLSSGVRRSFGVIEGIGIGDVL